jgi:hypothetical protein
VIEALKEAKAEVFETLNDLTAEKKTMINMEKNIPQFKKVNFIFVVVVIISINLNVMTCMLPA